MSLFGGSEQKKSSKITVVAQIYAKSGHEDEVRSLVAKLVEPSQKEPGCLKYNVLEDVHYTGSFFTHEQWESEEALDQHLQLHKAGLNQLKALLREDLKINVLNLLA